MKYNILLFCWNIFFTCESRVTFTSVKNFIPDFVLSFSIFLSFSIPHFQDLLTKKSSLNLGIINKLTFKFHIS